MQSSMLQFAKAIQQTLDYRVVEMSQIEAATQACRNNKLPSDWSMIVQLTLDGSATLAANWSKRIIEKNLDTMNEGAFR